MNTKIKDFLIIILVLVGAVAILLVSISRATLEIMVKNEIEDKLRTEEVIIDDKVIYKLPQSWVLPDNKSYIFKEARNWLWQKFSFGEENKIQIALILADKKIAESIALVKKEKYDLALKTCMKAVEKLEYADKLIEKMENNNVVRAQKSKQVEKTMEAYTKIIEEMGKNDKIDEQKYFLLLQSINEFKEKQTQKKEAE